jgi:hypothetical protein
MFVYDNYVKSGVRRAISFRVLQLPNGKAVLSVIKKVQTGSLLNKLKVPTQDTECSWKRNWIKLVPGWNAPIKISLDIVHMRLVFGVSFKSDVCSVSENELQCV